MLQPEIKVRSRLAKNTLGTFCGCQDCKLLKVLEILNPFFFFLFPIKASQESQNTLKRAICASPSRRS